MVGGFEVQLKNPRLNNENILVARNTKNFFRFMSYLAFADPRGTRYAPPPPCSKLFHFHAVFSKNYAKSYVSATTSVAGPSLGNLGSATVWHHIFEVKTKYFISTTFIFLVRNTHVLKFLKLECYRK